MKKFHTELIISGYLQIKTNDANQRFKKNNDDVVIS